MLVNITYTQYKLRKEFPQLPDTAEKGCHLEAKEKKTEIKWSGAFLIPKNCGSR